MDDATQTADVPVQRKFDPIAIFYDQMSTQPSTREIVAQVRNEMAQQSQKTLQSTLEQLTQQHNEQTRILNTCLQSERTQRALEKGALQSQIDALTNKLKDMQANYDKNVCVKCGGNITGQNDAYISELNEQISGLKQTNLEQQYRIAELEQYLSQCTNDLKLSE